MGWKSLSTLKKPLSLKISTPVSSGLLPPSRGFDLDSLYPGTPTLVGLSAPFTPEEVKGAFLSMNKLSSPGPAGFGSAFFSTFWATVAPDVWELFSSFYDGDIDLERINRAFLVLLPKVDVATHPSQFRPISLQNCVMKAITKVLTTRLQAAIQSLVDADQTGFLSGRRILENIVYAADLLRCCHSRSLSHPLAADIPCPVLQYADDTLILCKAASSAAACLRQIRDAACLGELSATPSFLEKIFRECLPLYRTITRVAIQDGRSTSFWFDKWLSGSPLAERFPALFSHCTRQHATVATVVARGLDLQPRLTTVAGAELSMICQIIDDIRLTPLPDDRVIDSTSAPRFSSREAYRMLSPQRPRDESACTAWALRLPSKLKIFTYLLDIDRLSTRANLFYKHCAPSEVCASCLDAETGRHLFFDCSLAAAVRTRLEAPIPDGQFSIWDIRSPLRSRSPPGIWEWRQLSGPSGKDATILSSTEDPRPRVPRCSDLATTLCFGGGVYRLPTVWT
ncbi:hypothetical protein QYE76_032361 [Lolium multiflorum]|uniref:Reverse transcriptase zinc-binding domain-containing protein n=1 Tax=Lolium multiflorum TaxID=4521 RepID=A0AAD8VL93_LOLMU|nr:hypothetical protein QYE76_032361 [Lolium multiflorum]